MTLVAPVPLSDLPSPEEIARRPDLVDRASAGARLLTARGVGMRVVSVASNLALLALVTPADLGLLAVVRGTDRPGRQHHRPRLCLGAAAAPASHPPAQEYAALAGIQLAIVAGHPAARAGRSRPGLRGWRPVPPAWRWWLFAVLATTLTVPFGTSAKIRIERNLDYRKIAFYDVSSVLLLNLLAAGLRRWLGHFVLGVFLATGGTILYANLLLWLWSPGPLPGFRSAPGGSAGW